jgi:hypothetical protein
MQHTFKRKEIKIQLIRNVASLDYMRNAYKILITVLEGKR